MDGRLSFTIEEVDPVLHVMAVCRVCLSTRYLTRPLLAETAPGQSLARVEQRVRCIDRKYPRGAACGGPMTVEFYRMASAEIEARGSTVEEAEALADFTKRRA